MPDTPEIVPFSAGATTGFLHVPAAAASAAAERRLVNTDKKSPLALAPSRCVGVAARLLRSFGLVLTHGAGANCQAPLLVAVAGAFASAGFHVLRCDLPFRQRRRFGPPHPSGAGEDREGLKRAVAAMRGIVSGSICLGGHSYGGRQATILAAEDHSICDALLLLSYPLHPPTKPEQPRTSHFASLNTPARFVHGTKDPFGSVEEMQAALRLIPAKTQLAPIDGAGHDLKRGKFDTAGAIVIPLRELIQD